MPNRDYFTDADLELFMTDDNWEKKLFSKVDFKTSTEYKEKRNYPSRHNITFLNVLITENLIYSTEKIQLSSIIEKLEKAKYTFSLNDFKPWGGYYTEKDSLLWLEIFETAKSKGFNLKDISKEILSSFVETESEELLQYIETNIGPIRFDNIKELWSNLGDDDNLDTIKQYGVSPSSMLSKKEIKEAQDNLNHQTQKILTFIEKATLDQILELFESIRPTSRRVESYIYKNKLSINPFHISEYENQFIKKPRAWFTEHQLKVIDVLESKTNQIILEKTPSNAKDKFKEIKDDTGRTFNEKITLIMKDSAPTLKANKKKQP